MRVPSSRAALPALSTSESLAVELLATARRLAERHDRDPWDFAVELNVLLAAGITVSDLRSLVCQNVVVHAREILSAGSDKRRFRRLTNLGFPPATCFVLAAHIKSPRRVAGRGAPLHAADACELTGPPTVPRSSLKPSWDRAARTLLLDGRVIKQLRVPARCQEIVLGVFEESGWPRCIDDPLPPCNGEDTRYRLHNTIKSLNGHQLVRRLHFTSNGDGSGVCWELVEQVTGRPIAARRAAHRIAAERSRSANRAY